MAEIVITKENFEKEVLSGEKPVLLDFWATWCGPCRMVAPILEAIAKERNDIVIGKVDVDAQPELAASFGVASIPTLVVIRGGKVVASAVGYRPKADIEALLQA